GHLVHHLHSLINEPSPPKDIDKARITISTPHGVEKHTAFSHEARMATARQDSHKSDPIRSVARSYHPSKCLQGPHAEPVIGIRRYYRGPTDDVLCFKIVENNPSRGDVTTPVVHGD
ncbi:methylthioribulose-1-phosphate dehydratase, partial [Striga asiatica]